MRRSSPPWARWPWRWSAPPTPCACRGWAGSRSDAATLAAVESCHAPLFNHYDDGGVLIWFAPDRPVFVDSRQDPYPLPFMLDAIAVERGDRPYQPLFARWGIGCAFLKASSKMTDRLRADGWQARAVDADWAVLAARGRRDAGARGARASRSSGWRSRCCSSRSPFARC